MGTRLESVALEIQKFHDNTIPEGDVYNVQRFGDEMLERMQTPEARMRMDRAFHASPAELSRAAVEAAKKAKR